MTRQYAQELPLEQITAKAFRAYERVRRSGLTNMLMPEVARLALLTPDEHLTIVTHYTELHKRFNPQRKETP